MTASSTEEKDMVFGVMSSSVLASPVPPFPEIVLRPVDAAPEGVCLEGSHVRLETGEVGCPCTAQGSQYGHCGGIGPGGGAHGWLYQDSGSGGAICGYILRPCW